MHPLRIAVIANMVDPNRVALFERVARQDGIELLVVYETGMEANRSWEVPADLPYRHVRLRSASIDLRRLGTDAYLHLALRPLEPVTLVPAGRRRRRGRRNMELAREHRRLRRAAETRLGVHSLVGKLRQGPSVRRPQAQRALGTPLRFPQRPLPRLRDSCGTRAATAWSRSERNPLRPERGAARRAEHFPSPAEPPGAIRLRRATDSAKGRCRAPRRIRAASAKGSCTSPVTGLSDPSWTAPSREDV